MNESIKDTTLQKKDNIRQAAADVVGSKGKVLSDNRPLIQKKANNTGLPDNLKSGIENLSGHAMDDVKVHYNSDKPAQLNAHAYAQGSEIHLASGQEKHLPHEAWHVVQQKQGRVKPTMQMKGKVNVNDDDGLEKEADVMGTRTLQMKGKHPEKLVKENGRIATIQRMHTGDGNDEKKDSLLERGGDSGQSYSTFDVPQTRRAEEAETGVANTHGRFSTTYWYKMDVNGKLHPKFFGYSTLGWKQLGKHNGLPVYISKDDYGRYELKFMQKDIADSKEVILTKTKKYFKTLLNGEKEIEAKLKAWRQEHFPLYKILIGLLGITTLGIGAIIAMHYLPAISTYIYLGTAAISELLGIIYIVKWYNSEDMNEVTRFALIGVNGASMVTAALTVTQHLIDSAPVHSLVWGAMPFGLVIGNLLAALSQLQRIEREKMLTQLDDKDD